MKGSYLLLLKLDQKVSIKHWTLEAGIYVYVGSAMGDLSTRVARHLRKHKRKHWHIDYLLEHAEVLSVIMLPSERRLEEEISSALSKKFDGPKGFGSSDLKVKTNLYRLDDLDEFFKILKDTVRTRLGEWPDGSARETR
ncbi:GIY-YIG nuclease family protein [Pseudothermotoga sp.]